MYFPVGWPKILDLPSQDEGVNLLQISCDRTKILFVILTDNSISVWNKNPCIPIVLLRRDEKSLEKHGKNVLVEWKPDSSMLVVATTEGTLLIYTLEPLNSDHGVYNQVDSKFQNLRRDSAELFIKESIPSLGIQLTAEVPLYVPITCITCVSVPQMMVATKSTKILRIRWDGQEERDFTLDLQRIPFSINQQVSYAVPIVENKIHVTSMDYSPLIGGFAIVLSDGRAAYLTANTLKFDPNQVQGIWAQNVDDASCASINHKYRLLAFGRRNSQAVVYTIDDLTGGLELSHTLLLSAKDFPGSPGPVREMKWTPDGCAVVLSWANGGVSLWSTFGSTLMCSLGWDYGLNVDLVRNNPLNVISMDWAKEGYQLLMVRQQKLKRTDNDSGSSTTENAPEPEIKSSLVVLDFVKSSMTANPCMSSHPHLLLQGENKLYMNQGDSMRNIRYKSKMFATTNEDSEYADSFDSPLYSGCKQTNVFSTSYNICTSSYIKGEIKRVSEGEEEPIFHANDSELGKSLQVTSILAENKHWVVIQIPTAYMACNWPIRYSAIDKSGTNLAVAARLGFALYSVTNRKWKLFGNETQEKDFIVTGGLMWWEDFIIMGSYSILEESDELRMYPKEAKLDNRFARVVPMAAPVMLINLFKDQLVVFTNDGFVTSFAITRHDEQNVDLLKLNVYDIRSLFIHPACVVSVTMTNLKNETIPRVTQVQQSETLILNVSGRLLMVQREGNGNTTEALLTSTCLASCVECIWLSESHRNHLKESLWLFCGGHGMRVWLPVIPRDSNNGHRSHRHTFMSRRIMLSFSLRVYPLAILFEDAIILGVENDTVLYTSDLNSHFSLPFCVLERTSQVYLHQILRQLIRKNLGYNAWEIARSCTNLPYFPHSLELLLHEVLEEEATSKEPIPDALLPSVLEFIQEFPVYLQTVVQCARKTEIALWPYLFATAGKPKDLFQQCLASKQLETAASYLIILQNLEPSAISRQFATLLLDTALELHKWDLARDLVRFLRAIDPNDVESPRTSFVMGHQKLGLNQQPVSPNAEDLSLILGTMARGRSFSTTINPKSPDNVSSNQNAGPSQSASTSFNYDQQNQASSQSNSASRKKSVPQMQKEKGSATPEEFFIDVILQRHARRLLQERRFIELGMMSAALDFHLVGWLTREKDRAARVEDFVIALKQLHEDLDWPKPTLDLKLELSKAQNLDSHQDSPSYSLQSLKLETNIETVDSGYTSLPIVESGPANYDPKLSELVLKNLIANPKDAEKHEAEAKLEPHLRENNSISSEQMSSWADEEETAFQRQSETVSLDSSEIGVNLMPSEKSKRKKLVSHKLEVKMRYLLQIFTEANCLELSLLISVLIMDAASISRITNAAIRSSSLQLCRQLRNGLKDMTRWSFQECLGYRTFFINLQPQIYHLDNFVLQKEAIIPYVDTKFPLQDGVQFGNNSKVTPLRNSVPLERKGVVEPVSLLKRSDSIRSSAGIHGSPKHFEELRKSKTELNLSVKRKPPLESISQGCATPTNASSLNGPSSLAQDNSNCVLM